MWLYWFCTGGEKIGGGESERDKAKAQHHVWNHYFVLYNYYTAYHH